MDAQSTDTEAVVVAIARDNGQVVVYNIGDAESRNGIYDSIASYALFDAIGSTRDTALDMSARIVLNKGGEK